MTRKPLVETFRKYDRTMLPVVDSLDRLVGVVTVDDVLDVATEEVTEDIQKMGAVEALDAPYLETGMLAMIQKRVGWLVLLFLGQMLTASAMAHYESDLASALVLAMFIPLIISSGGNSGAQASTLVIRAMATSEVRLRDWLRVFRRELVLGLALGAVLAVIGFLRIAFWPNRETSVHEPLSTRGNGGGAQPGGGGGVRQPGGGDAAVWIAPAQTGSSHLLRALCGHARGRERIDHLLQHRPARLARRVVVAAPATETA